MSRPLLAALFAGLLGTVQAAPVTLTLDLMNDRRPFEGTVTTSGGQALHLKLWQFYVSQVALVNADGSEQALSGLNLVKVTDHGPFRHLLMFSGSAPAGDYRGVNFSIGVPRALNHRDATFAAPPLSVDDGMYWAWNAGYLFSRFEGEATLPGVGGAAVPTGVALHFGEDSNFLAVTLTDLLRPQTTIHVPEQGVSVPLTLNVARLVGTGVNGAPFDLSKGTYQQIHFGAAAAQLRANLASAFSLGSGGAAGPRPATGPGAAPTPAPATGTGGGMMPGMSMPPATP